MSMPRMSVQQRRVTQVLRVNPTVGYTLDGKRRGPNSSQKGRTGAARRARQGVSGVEGSPVAA